MGRFIHEIIRASAGTGKTYQLTNQFLRLLRSGEPLDQILATTFTRKAAGEILDRVLHRLAEAATSDKALKQLRQALDDTALTRDDCRRMLVQTARNLHRLRVGTLDSFFAQLAGNFSLELGMPPGWRIADEHVDAALRLEAIDALLHGDSTSDLLTLMHLLAKGETSRGLSQMIKETVDQLYVVYAQTTAEVWQQVPRPRPLPDAELREAIDRLGDVALPSDKRWAKAREKDVEGAANGDWEVFLKQGIACKVLQQDDKYYGKPIDDSVLAAYQPLIGHARAVLLNQLADQTEATYRLLDKFDGYYQRLKTAQRALRFDDVTNRLDAFASVVGVEGAAYRLDAHVTHLLVDEFQDTSLAQWHVVRPFAERITNAEGRGASFFCVGDIKQAIYGWRGGVAEIFDTVEQQLRGIQPRPLDTSYRSAPEVIETVNRIFSHICDHTNLRDVEETVRAWCQAFRPHQTARRELSGYASLRSAPAAEDNEKQAEATLRFAADQIAELVQQSPGFSIGVLARKNDAIRTLIYHLREQGIDASEEGGNPLTDSAAVRIVLSLLKLADHPGDQIARFHLANSPLASLLEAPEGVASGAAAERLSRRVRTELLDHGYGPTIYGWAKSLAASCNRRELNRLEKLIALAYSYQPTATLRTSHFLNYVATRKVSDPSAADVRVMSIHQSKGLQFDIVVLPDLDADITGLRDSLVVGRPTPTEPIDRVCRYRNETIQQLLPESLRRVFAESKQRDAVESLCVLYVAVTRAIHALHMIVAPSAENERTVRRTYAGLLRAALADEGKLSPATLVFEHGNCEWYCNPGVEKPPSASELSARAAKLKPIQVKLARGDGVRKRNLQRVSPSGLEGGDRVRLTDGGGRDRAASLVRGTLIHAWFEQIEWLDDGRPNDGRLRQVANEVLDVALSPDELDRLLAEFHAMLDDRRITDCLSRPAYSRFDAATLKVENERPIAVREQDRLLVGNIDRLVTIYRDGKPLAADILDFKTDLIPNGDKKAMRERVQFYKPQIEAYRRAVMRIAGLAEQAVTARLLFVSSSTIVNV